MDSGESLRTFLRKEATPALVGVIGDAMARAESSGMRTHLAHVIDRLLEEESVRARVPEARYHEICRIVEVRRSQAEPVGLVALAAAGTSDLPVAEEAAVALEVFGSRVERVYDVGVAGIHRLFAHADVLRRANCVIAVAGMEGALPSVVGGLVDVPVIAVPTSVGYGTSFGGITALLAMLNSCASGISVVNIDNGFGAAYQADMINKLAVRGRG